MTLRKRCGPPAWRRKARTKFLPKKIRDKIVLTWNRVNTRSCPRSAASFFCRSSENDVRTINGTHNVSDTTPLYGYPLPPTTEPETRRAAKERREQYQRQMK